MTMNKPYRITCILLIMTANSNNGWMPGDNKDLRKLHQWRKKGCNGPRTATLKPWEPLAKNEHDEDDQRWSMAAYNNCCQWVNWRLDDIEIQL